MTAPSTNRVPIWESHIRPMFRLIDREHMKPMVDLGDYDAVRKKATDIVRRFSSMPPAATGGPWPEEWQKLFQRWIDTGFQRLQVPTPEPPGYTLQETFDGWQLSAQVKVPNPATNTWLEVVEGTPDQRTYVLYAEVPHGGGGQPVIKSVQDTFDRGTLENVQVQDGSGTHTVPFPP